MSTGTGQGGNNVRCLMRNQKGVIILEFVFTITILMVIFLATLTFSFLFADYYGAQKVATEGAREASITKDISWARTKAAEAAWLWGLDPGRTTLDFYSDSTSVSCTVHYTARPFNRTFPRLLEGSSLQNFELNTRATYVWSDTR